MSEEDKKTRDEEQHDISKEPKEERHGTERTWWPWALLIAAVLLGAGLLIRPMYDRQPAPIRFTEPVPEGPRTPNDLGNDEAADIDVAPIDGTLDRLEDDIDNGNWREAELTTDKLEDSWEETRTGAGRAYGPEADEFTQTLQRLRTAVDRRDQSAAKQAIELLRRSLRGLDQETPGG